MIHLQVGSIPPLGGTEAAPRGHALWSGCFLGKDNLGISKTQGSTPISAHTAQHT